MSKKPAYKVGKSGDERTVTFQGVKNAA